MRFINCSVFLFNFLLVLVVVFLGETLRGSCLVVDYDFRNIGGFVSCLIVVVDWGSILFRMAVSIISFSVMVFSHFYMSHEKFKRRFSLLVSLFVFFMNFLIYVPSVM